MTEIGSAFGNKREMIAYEHSSRRLPLAESIALGLMMLIFVEHLIYVLTKIRLMNVFYGLAALLVAYKMMTSSLKRQVAVYLLAYVGLILLFALYGVLVNSSISVSGQQAVYYLKPVIFFLVGYYFLSERSFLKLVEFVWWFSITGTVIFYFFSDQLINLAAEHLNLATFGFYEAFGLISRNISWYVSPLEFAALCMFLVFYYVAYQPPRWKWKAFFSAVMICSTFSRSIILAGIAAYCLSKVRLSSRNLISLAILAILGLTAVLTFDDFFLQYFVHEGSASVHHEILRDSIELILTHPFGLGIGASGWAGYEEAIHWYFYSEGTVGMVFIEIGWLALVLFGLLTLSSFRISRHYGLLCVAFLIACLIVPIGVSTFFICLFFLFFGMKVKRNHV